MSNKSTSISTLEENICAFFSQYKYILVVSMIIGIYANSVDIFTFKFGIDSVRFGMDLNGKTYYDQQRYGSYILNNIFPFFRYHIISQITGLLMICLSALLVISRHNIPYHAKAIFVITIVTFPNFSFLQYFYFQSVYNFIALLMTVISYKLIEMNTTKPYNYILSILLLAFAISSYHALFAVFLTVLMINVLLDFMQGRSFTDIIKFSIIAVLVLIAACCTYYVSILILHDGVLYHYSKYDDSYGTLPIYQITKNICYYIINTLISKGHYGEHLFLFPAVILYSIFIIIFIVKNKNLLKTIQLIVLNILLILAVFSITIVLGKHVPSRGSLAVGFLFSIYITIIMIYIKHKYLKYLMYIFITYAVLFHTGYISKYYTATMLQYEEDRDIANHITNMIYKVAPDISSGKYKLAFYGKLHTPQHKRYPLKKGKDVFGASKFMWDNGNPLRMIWMLYLTGLPTNVKLANAQEMKEQIDSMPSYPSDKCVKVYNDTIIVKLQ